MNEQIEVGQEVTLQAYGDTIIHRVVVAVENMNIFVCKREEWEAALVEKREPSCIGFKMADLVYPVTASRIEPFR